MSSTNIQVPTLAGGVCTLAASRCLPSELRASINGHISKERSWERRAPVEFVFEKEGTYRDENGVDSPSNYQNGFLSYGDMANETNYPGFTRLDESYIFEWIVKSDSEAYLLSLNADSYLLWDGNPSPSADLEAILPSDPDYAYGQYYSGNNCKLWKKDGTPQEVILNLPNSGQITDKDGILISTSSIKPWKLNLTLNNTNYNEVNTGDRSYLYEHMWAGDVFEAYLTEGQYNAGVGYKGFERIKFSTVQDTTFILNTQRNFGWFPTTIKVGASGATTRTMNQADATTYWCTYNDGTDHFLKVKDDIRVDLDGLEVGHCRENFLLLPVPTEADLIAYSSVDNELTPTAMARNSVLVQWDIYRGIYPDRPNTTGTPGSGEAYSGGSTAVTEPLFLRGSTGGKDYHQSTAGLGKIYYCRKGIGIYPPGYYRVVSLKAPYYELIREPGENCMVDPSTMPLRLKNVEEDKWVLECPYFEPRKSGDSTVNPGPKAWQEDSFEFSDVKIWRDRMWFSGGDYVFSSRLGGKNIYDFFMSDPTQILSSDPIDLVAGTDKETTVVELKDGSDTMLVVTDSDVQLEVVGSNNVISPDTVTLSRISNFTTNRFTKTIRISRGLYYFSQDKLFFYYSNPQSLTLLTEDLSKRIPGYLPTRHRHSCSSPAYGMLFTVGTEDQTEIYINYSLMERDQMTINAFHKWTIDDYKIFGMQTLADQDDNTWLYLVLFGPDEHLYMARINLDPRKVTGPFLDFLRSVPDNITTTNISYDSGLNWTNLSVDGPLTDLDTVVLSEDWGDDLAGTILDIVNVNDTVTSVSPPNIDVYHNVYSVLGDYDDSGKVVYVGKSYESSVSLPEPVLRDPDNGSYLHAILNVKRINILFDRSGPFELSLENNLTLHAIWENAITASNWEYTNNGTWVTVNSGFNEGITTLGEFRHLVMKPAFNLITTIRTSSPNPLNILGVTYECRYSRKSNPRAI